MAFDLTYLGHSAFEIKTPRQSILIDPFLQASKKYDYRDSDITDIFLTHGHSDHIGSAIDIAINKKATITAVFELANYCTQKGTRTRGINFGAWLNYDWGKALFVPAFHSSSLPDGRYGGCAASILFNIDNTRIYHAGDTCLHEGMKTVKELYRPQIAMLPIGGRYTMDAEHAAIAAQWIGAQRVIPMHYNTFPEIKAEVQQFAQIMQANTQMIVALDPNKQ